MSRPDENQREPEEKLTRSFIFPFEKIGGFFCFRKANREKLTTTFGITHGEIYIKKKGSIKK